MAILGASGKLGDLLIARALDLGHEVKALARDPRGIKRHNERLTVIKGDAETGEGLEAVVERCQFVISALGSLKPQIEKCLTHVVLELEQVKRLERFVMISRLGAGGSLQQSSKASGPLQPHLPRLMRTVFRDITAAEALVRVSRLPYTILRATRLTDGSAKGEVVTTEPSSPAPHRVSRTDLAHFVLEMLDQPQWHRKEVTVGSK